MERIESPAMKEFLVKFVEDTLSNNELFTDTFGKNFARKRLEINLNKVYTTNEESQKRAGYYNCDTRDITLCRLNEAGEMLSPDDITKDMNSEFSQAILHLLLHESVHAVFAHNEMETGIHFVGKGDLSEYGRAINEGLTEWITVKAGVDERRIGYRTFYGFIKELELALGPEAVMKLCGSKNIKDVSKILGFRDKGETICFLLYADEIYKDGEMERNAGIVKSALLNKKPRENFNEEEESEYKNFFEDDLGYSGWLTSSGLKDSDESKIGYLTYVQKDSEKDARFNKMLFDSNVFDRYFKEEFEEFAQAETISEEAFRRFIEIRKLMGYYPDEKLSNENYNKLYSSVSFINKFQEIQDKYVEILLEELNEAFDSKRITPELLEDYGEKFRNISLLDENNGLESFNSFVSEKISGKDQDEPETASIKWLLQELERKGELKDFSKYSISIKDTDDGDLSYIYLKDGKPVFSQKGIKGQSFSVKDEIPMSAIDFTEEIGEDVQKRVKNFLDFKAQILRINPNAQIIILDREIAANLNGVYTYFKFCRR